MSDQSSKLTGSDIATATGIMGAGLVGPVVIFALFPILLPIAGAIGMGIASTATVASALGAGSGNGKKD